MRKVKALKNFLYGRQGRMVKTGEVLEVPEHYYHDHSHVLEPVENKKMNSPDYKNKMNQPNIENKSVEGYNCPYCGKEFSSKNARSGHMGHCSEKTGDN